MVKKTAKLPDFIKGSCLSRIQSLQAAGKNNAATISKFVLEHPDQVTHMTLTQLAAKTSTSVASISRFCTLLGYESYRAFLIDLTTCLAGGGVRRLPTCSASATIHRP